MSIIDGYSLSVFIICLVIYALKDFLIRSYKVHMLDMPCAPGGYPIVGIIPDLLGQSQESRFKTILKYTSLHTGLMKVWVGPLCFININEPKYISKVLTSDVSWTKAKMVYDQVPFGEGLFTGNNFDNWKMHRRIFSYSFTRKNLINFTEIFVDSANKLVDSISTHEGKTFNFYDYIFKCCMDVHLKTLFKVPDYDNFEKNGKDKLLLDAYNSIDDGMAMKLKYPTIYPDTIYKITDIYKREYKGIQESFSTFRNLLRQHKKYLQKKYSYIGVESEIEELKKEAFIDQVVYYENELTKKQIDDHMLSIISPHKTLGLELTQAMLLLAMHPEVQEECYKEIKHIFPSKDSPVDYESVQQMFYMDRVIKETMRLFPAIPFILRNTMEEMELGEYKIPAGVNLFISIFSIHRNKDLWGEDANEFKPDRFLPENISKVDPSSFIPFSLGKRNCVGKQFTMQSMKIIMKQLVENYKFSTPLKYEEIRLKNDMTLKLCTKPLMNIEKR